MKKRITTGMLLLSLFCGLNVQAQSVKEQAFTKAKEAMRLEDAEGKYDEAIKLFEEARALDPENIAYPYELAYAYSAKKEYKKASDILEKLLTHKDVNAHVYQALGNAYDHQGKSELAITTYEKGLKRYPSSGELYLELGNMQLVKKEYEKALSFYEKGIKLDPTFPSNYYWASKIYCSSDEEVWGMIYGEIFMNLERSTKRTGEISRLLFDTYKSAIKFKSDTTYNVSFSKNATIDASSIKDGKKIKLPYGTGVYEMLMALALVGEKDIDINSLDRIRTRFVENYYKGDIAKDYPNALFDYQKSVLSAGHIEAYNHWLLMTGDEAGFRTWQENNKAKWDRFIEWFRTNQLKLDAFYYFYSGQYQVG